LEVHDCSPHSVRAYLSDRRQFVAWLAEHTSEIGETITLETATERLVGLAGSSGS